MAVIPIKAGMAATPPAVDEDLVTHLELLLAHAKAGEIQGFCAGYVIHGEGDLWFMADEGQIPLLSFFTRKSVEGLESDDD